MIHRVQPLYPVVIGFGASPLCRATAYLQQATALKRILGVCELVERYIVCYDALTISMVALEQRAD